MLIPPHSYLQVNMEHIDGLGGKFVNDYTLTLDIMIDKLPNDSIALLQTNSSATPTEGEAFIYATGGIGVFGELGVQSNLLPGRWNRVVITYGRPSLGPVAKAKQFTHHSKLAPDDERLAMLGSGLGGSSSSNSSSRFKYGGGSLHDNSSMKQGVKTLTTYVNARKCASISSEKRGVLAATDGRFSLNPNQFNLFSSSRLDCKSNGNVLVKYVSLSRGAMTEDEVKRDSNKNRIFSLWQKQQAAEMEARDAHLTLRPMYKRPPPLWNHPMVVAEFGDAYLENTGLEGGELTSCVTAYELLLSRFIGDIGVIQSEGFDDEASVASASSSSFDSRSSPALRTILQFGFTHEEMQSFNYLCVVLKQTKSLCHNFDMAKKNGLPQLVSSFMRSFKSRLNVLKSGETIVCPGGFNDTLMLYVIEKEDDDSYRFSIVNSDPNNGLDYHLSSSSEAFSAIKYKTVLTVSNVVKLKI